MVSPYPGALRTYPQVANDIDVYEDFHINDRGDDIIALQTFVGTNPHGDRGNLSDRLNAQFDGSGYIIGSDGFPADTTPRRFHYRNDQETLYIAKHDKSGFAAVSQSFSNLIYCWTGVDNYTENSFGVYVGTESDAVQNNPDVGYLYLFSEGASFQTHLNFKFTKLSGMNTATIHARLWGGSATATLRVSIGTVNGSVARASQADPDWATTADIDISGLGTGTTYNGVVELKSSAGNTPVYCSAVNIIAS